MSRENTYAPTPWKRPSNYIGSTWEGWLVFLSRNRDSDLLTNHNFETALEALRGVMNMTASDSLGEETVKSVSESHWACGWVEWIAIHPSDTAAVALASELADKLDTYPILDEDGYSEKEHEAMCDSWKNLSVRDRYELIKRSGNCSVFAARRADLPADDWIQEILRGWS